MPDAPRDVRAFRKRWGADFIRPGEARFRLWAPGLESLSLRLEGLDAAMGRGEDGWFELTATGAEAGSRYCFVLPDGRAVPDPAARAQETDVHGASILTDPATYRWRNAGWTGRPWREAIVYELHVGTFTPQGTFEAAAGRLEHLAQLGVTAVELMPLGQFSGRRGWGYDGVLPYAPHNAYGTPDDLKRLVDEAHGLGLMMLLDVVYNHFGPDGNYLPSYAPEFFDEGRHTPWGAAIAYQRAPVRQFFIDNALYWLEEFGFDGLRLDAVDQIADPSQPELLVELARRVRQEFAGRHVHLVTEDNRNITRLHERTAGKTLHYTAEWNDDLQNAAHVLLTGETEGYYADFSPDALGRLARSLAEGFAYQGEPSRHAGGRARGTASGHLPTTAFVDFLQNHDQIGNRGHGERLSVLVDERRLEALTAVLLLSPHIPLLFMGEEWGETRPFLFFTDYRGKLADDVREGRRREFAAFSAFGGAEIPDPNAPDTFEASRIDWDAVARPEGARRLGFVKSLIALRRERIVPLLDDGASVPGRIVGAQDDVLAVDWRFPGAVLHMRANLGERTRTVPPLTGDVVFRSFETGREGGAEVELPPCGVAVTLAR